MGPGEKKKFPKMAQLYEQSYESQEYITITLKDGRKTRCKVNDAIHVNVDDTGDDEVLGLSITHISGWSELIIEDDIENIERKKELSE